MGTRIIWRLLFFFEVRSAASEALFWLDALAKAGLLIEVQETLDKRLTFETWAARHTPEMQTRLRVLLLRAPIEASEFLDPQTHTGLTTFRLREGLYEARK